MTMDLSQLMSTFWRQASQEAAITPPLTAADRMVVAVSGGADSLALLRLLIIQRPFPLENIIVAHLNHGWRATAVADAEFVAQTAQAWGVACALGAVDAPALARDKALSLEEASREARYQFLRETAVQYQARFILTGHNADDQAETVLHNLLRGSGLTGLRGMLPISPLSDAPPIWLLRPLLAVPRAAIDAYCQANELTPLHDPSNQDTQFLRNRLRHDLLPLLRDYSPQISQHLQNIAEIAAAEVAFIEEESDQLWSKLLIASGDGWLQLDRDGWRAAPLALRRRLLRLAASRLSPPDMEIGLLATEQARRVAEQGAVGAQSFLPGAVLLTVGYETLTFTLAATAVPHDAPQLPTDKPIRLPVPGRAALDNGWEIVADYENGDLEAIFYNKNRWRVYLDGAKVGQLTLRGRLPGERFAPLGMGGRTVSLKELMINDKTPAGQRARWPLLADEAGAVWLVGGRLAERAKVTGETRQLIRLTCRRVV